MTAAGRTEPLLISLTRDGRLVDRASLDRFGRELAGVTDCFVFCLGWLYDEAEAREEAAPAKPPRKMAPSKGTGKTQARKKKSSLLPPPRSVTDFSRTSTASFQWSAR